MPRELEVRTIKSLVSRPSMETLWHVVWRRASGSDCPKSDLSVTEQPSKLWEKSHSGFARNFWMALSKLTTMRYVLLSRIYSKVLSYPLNPAASDMNFFRYKVHHRACRSS